MKYLVGDVVQTIKGVCDPAKGPIVRIVEATPAIKMLWGRR
jgi:hypothetical protein